MTFPHSQRVLSEALHKFLDDVISTLYPNLCHAAVTPKGTEADEILKAANLDALRPVFGSPGLNLFERSGGTTRYNPDAAVARDILGYVKEQVDFGEKPLGRNLEDHFAQPLFGWEADVVRVALAGLYRAGAIRITTKAALTRTTLTNNPGAR